MIKCTGVCDGPGEKHVGGVEVGCGDEVEGCVQEAIDGKPTIP
jgi:hypothetical protein